jgi:hypothetical protein
VEISGESFSPRDWTKIVARCVFLLQWAFADPTVKQILSSARNFLAVTATRPQRRK